MASLPALALVALTEAPADGAKLSVVNPPNLSFPKLLIILFCIAPSSSLLKPTAFPKLFEKSPIFSST
jgi:hypothetical protein